ncbi:SufE family protein [Iodobacter sp. LRB]|uniref:SufE family protein n=1 Tax=unclassified Iodobacter TaxID=235634 RepID=UPI000C0E4CB6|nr:SufE family protein [Iodobacter sp. BJB302]PHV01698.1 Fe-S metabolism protein SufE [Iodobacter sp. BJB302]
MNKTEIESKLASAHGWEGKNRLLVQLARDLAPLPATELNDENRIVGCESTAWLKISWQGEYIQLAADSESRIVKGLLVLLMAAYQGKTRQEISDFDCEAWLIALGLTRFLSASRGNGVKAVIGKIHNAIITSPH